MIVKKMTQCGNCRNYINIYKEERKKLTGIKIECKSCDEKLICISDNNYISKWRSINE